MKSVLSLLLMLGAVLSILAQEPSYHIEDAKRDWTWVLSLTNATTTMQISPDTGTPQPVSTPSEIGMTQNCAIISDTAGQLLFFTNGVNVHDNDYQFMPGGESLYFNDHVEDYEYGGPPISQGTLILPRYGHPGHYWLLYQQQRYAVPEDSLDLYHIIDTLSYAEVYKPDANTPGQVISKGNTILGRPLRYGEMTACRHGNGRDWWVLVFDRDGSVYHRILVSPSGISVLDAESVEENVHYGVGQSKFSPDGSLFINHTGRTIQEIYLNIFDFDRCTGLLSEQRHLQYTDSTAIACGAEFSASGRYLYTTTAGYVRQLDTWAEDIIGSLDTVGIDQAPPDSAMYWWPTPNWPQPAWRQPFWACQRAANGKIYVNSTLGWPTLTTIHHPDSSGTACEVEQYSFDLLHAHGWSMPNFPNFRLGALAGSSCDTLGHPVAVSPEPSARATLQVYPNPTKAGFYIKGVQGTSYRAVLYDLRGRVRLQQSWTGNSYMDTGSLTSGMYLLRIYGAEGQALVVEKVVVQ